MLNLVGVEYCHRRYSRDVVGPTPLRSLEMIACAGWRSSVVSGSSAKRRDISPNRVKQSDGYGWQKLADRGNRLRHAYHLVDTDILWAVENDLEALRRVVEQVIEDEKK
jgi:uncharacterized protein with HEPN domain